MTMLRLPRAAFLVAVVMLNLAATSTADTIRLVGISALGNQLTAIDPATGLGSPGVPLNANVRGVGLGVSNGGLYTFDTNLDRIRRLDPITGATLGLIDIGIRNRVGDGDLTFRPDGVGFLATPLDPTTLVQTNDLYRFDLAAGTSVRLGSTGLSLQGLAFAGNTLYGLSVDRDTLYTVNQTTGALTAVGSLGVGAGSPFAALTADLGGNLFAALDDRLYSVNRQSGLATAVSSTIDFIGTSSISGLAFAPVPEPATLLMLGTGLVGAVLGGRRLARRR